MRIIFFFFFILIVSILLFCSTEQKNSYEIDIKLKKNNILWHEYDKDCSKNFPFCHKEFIFKEKPLNDPPKVLSNFSKLINLVNLRGKLYIFTPFKKQNKMEYILPPLPKNIDQEIFKSWFSQHIFPLILKNPFLAQREEVHYQKNSWSIRGVKLLHTTCVLNIYPKFIEHPFVFVFLWEGLSRPFWSSYKEAENWSINQFSAILSTKEISEDWHNI